MQKLFDKGQISLGNAPALVITLVIIGIVVGIGASVLQKFVDNINVVGTSAENSTAVNATKQGIVGIKNFADFLPTIGVVVAAAIILGLVLFLGFRGGPGR